MVPNIKFITTLLVVFSLFLTSCLISSLNTSAAIQRSVYSWGANSEGCEVNNSFGQLGNNTASGFLKSPAPINLSNIKKITGGAFSGYAITGDDKLVSWGDNYAGALGNGTLTGTLVPSQVVNLTNVVSVDGGIYNAAAVKSDGTVWAWGDNSYGLLGNGTSIGQSLSPVQVPGLSNVIQVSFEGGAALALKSDGTVWTWGSSAFLGDGTTSLSLSPVQVPGLSNVIQISEGGFYFFGASQTSYVLKSDGTVWAWGDNQYGGLGNGTTNTQLTPTQIPGLSGITKVSAGLQSAVFLKNDGTVFAVGRNTFSELGNGTTTSSSVVVQSAITGVDDISVSNPCGASHVLAHKPDGTLWSWGYNEFGQLGLGTTTNQSTPTQIATLRNVTLFGMAGMTSYAYAFQCGASSNSNSPASTSATTFSSICIDSGAVSLYPGDSNQDSDICSNDDINTTTNNPGSPVLREGVTCNASENSASLGSISTSPIRQNPYKTLYDVLFDDLRGQETSNYTVTAEISNFVDNNNNSNVISLGSNPDAAPAILDPGIISSIQVTNGGTGYTSAPTVAFAGGGGSGATATASVTGGIVTKIDVKSYGTGYTSSPTVVLVPTNGGSGASATANIIAIGDNLNPATSLPENRVFATLDPSVGTMSKLKPTVFGNLTNFSTGPRSLVTAPATQYTLFSTSAPVNTGRYKLDGTLFGLRTPAYLSSGDYRSVITQTIVVDSPVTYPIAVNTPPVANNFNVTVQQDTQYDFIGNFGSLFYQEMSDPDNSGLDFIKIMSLPVHGTLLYSGNPIGLGQEIYPGGLTYDPDPGYTGPDSFNWATNDGIVDSNTATVNITVGGLPPL
jgi:alpha-tubulin suppressor-like RCC1 family protein